MVLVNRSSKIAKSAPSCLMVRRDASCVREKFHWERTDWHAILLFVRPKTVQNAKSMKMDSSSVWHVRQDTIHFSKIGIARSVRKYISIARNALFSRKTVECKQFVKNVINNTIWQTILKKDHACLVKKLLINAQNVHL